MKEGICIPAWCRGRAISVESEQLPVSPLQSLLYQNLT